MLNRPSAQRKGKVYLVGAGPGDPDLLTVRAVRTLGFATVVLHDALVSNDVLALISPGARVIDVGKRCGRKHISQEKINDLLVTYATSGETVVRLKSGDPLVFGRAGEELDILHEAGIDVEIVSGITAGLAAAATLKTALTDRRSADDLLFVSAHRSHGKDDSAWRTLIHRRATIVVYMPGNCGRVVQELYKAGLSKSTPCAIVSKVSSPDEQWYRTTLASLDRAPAMPSPSILIVGETLAHREPRAVCPEGASLSDISGDQLHQWLNPDDWFPL